MTLRYVAHSPQAYFAEDASRIESALHGAGISTANEAEAAGGLRRA